MRDVTIWLVVAVGFVFLASLAAFFLYVPLMTVMWITTTLLALILMFVLGATSSTPVGETSED